MTKHVLIFCFFLLFNFGIGQISVFKNDLVQLKSVKLVEMTLNKNFADLKISREINANINYNLAQLYLSNNSFRSDDHFFINDIPFLSENEKFKLEMNKSFTQCLVEGVLNNIVNKLKNK